jgi:hypothetical protein
VREREESLGWPALLCGVRPLHMYSDLVPDHRAVGIRPSVAPGERRSPAWPLLLMTSPNRRQRHWCSPRSGAVS